MTEIHPTAIVEPGARLGEGVMIGPYCCVGGKVELGDGATLQVKELFVCLNLAPLLAAASNQPTAVAPFL